MHAFGSRQAPAAIAVKKKKNEKRKGAMPARARARTSVLQQTNLWFLLMSFVDISGWGVLEMGECLKRTRKKHPNRLYETIMRCDRMCYDRLFSRSVV